MPGAFTSATMSDFDNVSSQVGAVVIDVQEMIFLQRDNDNDDNNIPSSSEATSHFESYFSNLYFDADRKI